MSSQRSTTNHQRKLSGCFLSINISQYCSSIYSWYIWQLIYWLYTKRNRDNVEMLTKWNLFTSWKLIFLLLNIVCCLTRSQHKWASLFGLKYILKAKLVFECHIGKGTNPEIWLHFQQRLFQKKNKKRYLQHSSLIQGQSQSAFKIIFANWDSYHKLIFHPSLRRGNGTEGANLLSLLSNDRIHGNSMKLHQWSSD